MFGDVKRKGIAILNVLPLNICGDQLLSLTLNKQRMCSCIKVIRDDEMNIRSVD